MTDYDLLARIQENEILADSALYREIHLVKENNEPLVAELNMGFRASREVRGYLASITGKIIDDSVVISQPFYTDFGRHITFGKNIFINQNVTFVDLGGIEIEDDVMIGPMSRIITVNHLLDPEKRKGLSLKPVKIKKMLGWARM